MNKLNTKLLIGYLLLGALIIAVAREYGFFAFVILVGFLVFVLYRKKKNAADKSDQMPYLTKDKEAIIVNWGYLHKKLIFSEVQ